MSWNGKRRLDAIEQQLRQEVERRILAMAQKYGLTPEEVIARLRTLMALPTEEKRRPLEAVQEHLPHETYQRCLAVLTRRRPKVPLTCDPWPSRRPGAISAPSPAAGVDRKLPEVSPAREERR
jgi:hypothetical protein